MKRNSTFLLVAILLIALVCPGFILMSDSDHNPSYLSYSSNNFFAADTFNIDINMDEFDEEMKELQKELGKLRSFKFDFDFDNEKFKAGMEELKKELSELDLEEFHFEFDDEEFRMNMEEFKKELKERKYSFHFDMDNFKEEMRELKEELKHLDIDLDDLDIEMKKLDGFMDNLREELESDGLINDKTDEFDLDLSNDEMLINGDPVPDELFKKYKDMYEDHFGKKLNGDHNIIIR